MVSSCGHSVFFYTVIVRVQHGHEISLYNQELHSDLSAMGQ